MPDSFSASSHFCLPRSIKSVRQGGGISLAELKRLFAPVLVEMDEKPLLVGRKEPREAGEPTEAE